jgi:predicted RNase H-like HicB family nuclease
VAKAIDIDAPFDPAILQHAHEIALTYRYIIRPSASLGFTGRTLEMPLVMADGKTPEECIRKTVFGTETAVATMLERGESPPSSGMKRNEQINIRLTSEEKVLLEEESRRKGYRGLSDFVRAVALGETGGEVK